MSTLQVGVATSVIEGADGSRTIIPFNAQVAFQTVNNSPKVSKDIKANMAALVAAAEDENNTDINYDEVFYLPCLLRKDREVVGAPRLGIMKAGALTPVASAVIASVDGDQPF